MNQSPYNRPPVLPRCWLLVFAFLALNSLNYAQAQKPAAASFPADVVTSWIALQLKITQTTPAPPPHTLRRFAYAGIALYESIVPGLPGFQSIAPQLNGLSGLPIVKPTVSYYWPACANAALASMNRLLHPMTSMVNKTAIDSLENANLARYQKESSADELARSADFGKKIADAVFAWARMDGSDTKTAYILPTGDGRWIPTPIAMADAILPYWGKNRFLLVGSDAGADLDAPVLYSTDPSSAYYAQVKEVYDIAQTRTDEQKKIALFWADDPDGTSFGGGHWMAILNQILAIEKPSLDKAAVAFAQMSIAGSEATISVFKGKYQHNGLRPITYIRKVMNHPDWNTLIPTPPHPEYPSGHAVISAASAQTLTLLFGPNYKFTDHCYTELGLGPRSYNSFEEAAIEAGNSRVYGGIHYRRTCDLGQKQGKIIAQNIANKLKFKR